MVLFNKSFTYRKGLRMSKLNATQIKNIKVQDKEFTLNDGDGLHLLIKPNGNKIWEFRYTAPLTSKRRKISFGKYPSISLAEARLKRQETLKLLSEEIDPIEKKQADKIKLQEKQEESNHTVENILHRFFEIKQHNKSLKDITINKAKGRLENHIFPFLPKKEKTIIHDITFEMIVKILKRLEDDNKLETLDRIKRLLVDMYKFAYTENIIKNADLFAKLELKTFKKLSKADVKNHPTLTDINEVKKLLNDINNYQGEIYTKQALLLSMHTAQRQGSLISAKWENIDFENAIWTIPAERMRMKREHLLPLSTQVIEILKELKQHSGKNQYLFPNVQHNGSHMSNNTVNTALRNGLYK